MLSVHSFYPAGASAVQIGSDFAPSSRLYEGTPAAEAPPEKPSVSGVSAQKIREKHSGFY